MANPIKADLQVENFNRFFAIKAKEMTPLQKERLPAEVLARVFKGRGRISTERLSFLHQVYILQRAMNIETYILVGDENNGIGVKDWEMFKRQQNGKRTDSTEINHYLSSGIFVLGSRELMEYMDHLNMLSLTPLCNYILKLKNREASRVQPFQRELELVASAIVKYEGSRKKIVRQKGLSISDWLILLYLVDGKEGGATPIYTDVYKDSMNATRTNFFSSFKKLREIGYIQRFGKGKSTKYKITALGKSIVREVFNSYIIP